MQNDPSQHPPVPTAAQDLASHLGQLVIDVDELPGLLPLAGDRREPAARLLARIAEDAAEAAALIRALPSRPRDLPGHHFAAVAAIDQAVATETDFGGWLAGVLATVAGRHGSVAALVAGRSGSWESAAVLALVQPTVGYGDDENLTPFSESRTDMP